MNVRLPVLILIVIVIAFGAWYVLVHQNFTSTLSQTYVATTTPDNSTASPTLDPAAIAASAIGMWQSSDDPNYTVVIAPDGKWTDEYKGTDASSSVSQTGAYTLFTSANPDKDFTGTLTPGVVYLKVVEASTIFYYSVLEADGTNLQLSYLARGNTLSFTKVQ